MENNDIEIPEIKQPIFFVTEELYNKTIKKINQQYNFEPTSHIHFCFELPFIFPLKKQHINPTIYLGEPKYAVGVCLNKQKKSECDGIARIITECEIIVSTSIPFEELMDSKEQILNQGFDIGLEKLNELILGYQLYSKDEYVYQLETEMLPPVIFTKCVNANSSDVEELGLMVLHTNGDNPNKKLEPEEFYDVQKYIDMLRNNSNPLLLSERLQLSARRSFRAGFFTEAIVLLQTSIEQFLRKSYKIMLEESGVPLKELEQALDIPFMRLIRTYYSSKLNFTWDIDDNTTPVGRWYKNVYELRNKVIHEGYLPDKTDIQSALDSALEFRSFLFKEFRRNAELYPKLNSYLYEYKK